MTLPVNLDDLINLRTIESDRIEFKEGWNPDRIYRSICAFANDFDNSGGGYIIIGVEEENKIAKRPVKGLTLSEIASIQEKMIGFNNLIKPVYHPKLFVEDIDNKQIIVLWVPGGSSRPYEVPDNITSGRSTYNYRIRMYSNSIVPTPQQKIELLSLANQIPFDDRPNTNASLDDISYVLLNDFLRVTKSKLFEIAESGSKEDILDRMELISGPRESRFPRNVALMLFNEAPDRFFPYSKIEIVHFPKGAGDPEFFEAPDITGPVNFQIIKALDYLKTNLIQEKIRKVPDKSESVRIWNYPFKIFEEAIANALYHRDYSVREPVEIRIFPHSVSILNYGGPDRSIRMSAFDEGVIKARRYRNRRLGDFLKELHLTEGKATGIPTIKKALLENGSPAPHFETDDGRSYFQVEFSIHPDFIKIHIPKELLSPAGAEDIDILLGWIIENFSHRTARPADAVIAGNASGNEVRNYVSDSESLESNEVRTEANTLINSFINALSEDVAGKSNEVSNVVGNDVSNEVIEELSSALIKTLRERTLLILNASGEPLTLANLFKKVGLTKQTKSVNSYIRPLLNRDWIRMTNPGNPRSRNQKYFSTLKGEMILKLCNFFKKEN